MKKNIFLKKEFNKERLFLYFGLNVLVILYLIASSVFHFKEGIGVYVSLVTLTILLLGCIYLLFEFIILIPTTTANLKNICIGSSLLLSLILFTYANLFLQVYWIRGKSAYSFSGKHLSGNDFLYYSITTFTTTGYGDITSISIISNALAASEMLLGMVSNTIFMAIITSKLIKGLSK
jgi:voltage-gated potassium channel